MMLRRLAGELLRLSDPVRTQWQPLLVGWFDSAGAEVLGDAAFRCADFPAARNNRLRVVTLTMT